MGQQLCAAKTFFVSQSDFHQQSIQKEISVLQKLRCRHIVQFYQFTKKGSLAHAIKRGLLAAEDWPTKARLAHEIAQGLAYIHQENILHRDLKSANVLRQEHMEVKLADFGLAQVRSMASAVSRASGSTATTTAAPFKDQVDDALVALDVKSGRRETLPDDTPAEYRQWVERCWEQDPLQRPDACDIVLEQDVSAADRTIADEGDSSSTVQFYFSLLDTSHPLGTHDEILGDKAGDDGQQYRGRTGRSPSAEDDVIAHLCTAAKGGSSEQDAFLWYRQAAFQGLNVAQFHVAMMYEHGQGIHASDSKAFAWYQRAAKGGSPEVGDMWADGRVVKQDDVEAARWYDMATHQGQKGRVMLKPLLVFGMTQDETEGIHWLTKAAGQRIASAQRNLGLMYEQGRGIQQSDDEEVRWYAMAPEQGDALAQKYLGWMHEVGRGVGKSDVEAAKWYTKAAEHGDMAAQFNLGPLYDEGRGVEQNGIEAVKWFTKAAKQGDEQAQFNLGVIYKQRQGVQQNHVEAAKWFAMSAEQGNASAQRLGVEQSDTKAAKLYTKAAEHGHVGAQYSLGMKYKQGQGVDCRETEAAKWFAEAAKHGHVKAQISLGRYYK
ncbi:hypothetical protein BGZ73_001500 [Actinomortierella ambigua]|nr:hypothetical protein BGZ73_001500 [Actinomortierella ambigua]